MRAILVETFFLALFPSIAAAAVLVGTVAWFFRLQIDNRFKLRSLNFDIPAAIFIICGAISVFNSPARSFELIYNYCAIVGIYALSYILVGQNISSCGIGFFCCDGRIFSIYFRRGYFRHEMG